MRYLNFQNTALISFLVAGVAACSSGTDTPANTGAAATTSGAGGSGSTSAGTGGSSSTTSGTPSTTAASTTATTTAGTGGAGGAAGTTGTGGSGGSVPGAPSVCDGKGTRILTTVDGKVDNFEGPVISLGWSSFSDVMPTPNSFRIAQEVGGALGTGHFGHYAGTGARTTLLGGYGVGTIYNLAIDVTAGIYCVDITAFDGMTFWARAATATAARVGVNFVTPETNLKATDPLIGGGDCVNPGCYNHPQKLVTLTTTWAQYNVTFAEALGGTGARVKTVLQLVGFLSPDAAWDFSIDEIQLYKGTAPTGPVGGGDAGP
jgi:hypothetical protein